MNNAKMKSVVRLIIVVLCSYVLFGVGAGAQQQEQEPKSKFKPAPEGAKIIPDIFEVLFVDTLPLENFERELDRVLKQYNAELADPAIFGPDAKVKIPSLRFALIKMPEARAKQMAEDSMVAEVQQEFYLVGITDQQKPVPGPLLGPGKHRPPDKQSNPPNTKRPDNEDELQELNLFRFAAPDASRATTYYHLDRIDTHSWFYDGFYTNTNNGSANVDIYFFDTGINVSHAEFGTRAVMFRNYWPTENYFTSPSTMALRSRVQRRA